MKIIKAVFERKGMVLWHGPDAYGGKAIYFRLGRWWFWFSTAKGFRYGRV